MYNDFYVYAFYIIDTWEIFYIGKGRGKRCKVKCGRNEDCLSIMEHNKWDYIILQDALSEIEALALEKIVGLHFKSVGLAQTSKAFGGRAGWVSQETRDKTSLSMKQYCENNPRPILKNGKRLSDEHCFKIAQSLRARCGNKNPVRRTVPIYPEFRFGMSGQEHWGYGKCLLEDTKKKITDKALKKTVLCVETGAVYPSIREAERQTGINNACIARCCQKQVGFKTAGGFHWEYYVKEIK